MPAQLFLQAVTNIHGIVAVDGGKWWPIWGEGNHMERGKSATIVQGERKSYRKKGNQNGGESKLRSFTGTGQGKIQSPPPGICMAGKVGTSQEFLARAV